MATCWFFTAGWLLPFLPFCCCQFAEATRADTVYTAACHCCSINNEWLLNFELLFTFNAPVAVPHCTVAFLLLLLPAWIHAFCCWLIVTIIQFLLLPVCQSHQSWHCLHGWLLLLYHQCPLIASLHHCLATASSTGTNCCIFATGWLLPFYHFCCCQFVKAIGADTAYPAACYCCINTYWLILLN